jgi:thioredoxin-like negative regulator of GroEL
MVKSDKHGSSQSTSHDETNKSGISDKLFLAARNQYFKGNWFESESTINQILAESPHDIEARLLLLTLLRHTNRIEDALVQITDIQKWDEAKQWEFEIKRELELLELELTSQNKSDSSTVAA